MSRFAEEFVDDGIQSGSTKIVDTCGAWMPGQTGVDISECAVTGHIHFARQCFLGRAPVVDDLTLGAGVLEDVFCGDRTCSRGYAQEIVASAVSPFRFLWAAVWQCVVFPEKAD